LIRQTFHWNQMETSPGRFQFGVYDDYMAALARARMRVLPILFDPPTFRSRRGSARGIYPPRDPSTMAAFAATVARRYGPGGSFWRAHPGLPQVPIRAWQVWNEPSLPAYWASGPDPAAYTKLLRTVARGIRRVDPRAEVVSAGIPNSNLGVPFDEFVEGMEKAGLRSTRAVFAIHAFSADAEATVSAIADARKLLDAHDDHAQIWVTEVGWASGGPSSPFTVGEDGQARRVGAVLRRLSEERRRLGVRGVVYYDWKDAPPYPGGKDFFGLHTGLLRLNDRAKPALEAFRLAVMEVRCQDSSRNCVK
jgi:hypothetical protein